MMPKLRYFFIMVASAVGIHQAAAQGTAFTYQGRLIDNGVPATGSYDLRFVLFDAGVGVPRKGLPLPICP